jgi:hypothetical protein
MLAVLVISGYALLFVGLLLWGRYEVRRAPLMDDEGNVVEPYKPRTQKNDTH